MFQFLSEMLEVLPCATFYKRQVASCNLSYICESVFRLLLAQVQTSRGKVGTHESWVQYFMNRVCTGDSFEEDSEVCDSKGLHGRRRFQ